MHGDKFEHQRQGMRSASSRASITLLASEALDPATLAEVGSFLAFSSFLVPLPFFPILPLSLSPQPTLVAPVGSRERCSTYQVGLPATFTGLNQSVFLEFPAQPMALTDRVNV